MLSRRELITAGVAGGVAARADVPPSHSTEAQPGEREALLQIGRSVDTVNGSLQRGLLSNSLAFGFVGKLRDSMELFFKGNAKFPDFIDVGFDVFMDIYDWHIKNRQQLVVTRGIDNRYWMQFMFTTLLLRQEVDASYIGPPYDKA